MIETYMIGRYIPNESQATFASSARANRTVFLQTAVRFVAVRTRAVRAVAFVDLGVGIAQLNGNVTLEFVLETDSL